jgi:mono/diheme cytochrome c family protein
MLAAVTALALALPGPARGQAPSGPEVWAANCGRCHRIQPTNKYDARHWAIIVSNMALAARLTPEEEKAVREFLAGTSERSEAPGRPDVRADPRRLASLDLTVLTTHTPEAEKLFKAQCAPCHGVKGRGDGPVAASLQPKPADLTDPEFQAQRTDEQLREALVKGKGAMPPLGALLTPEEIDLLVDHIRSLVAEKK